MTAKQLMLPANRAFSSDGAPEIGATATLYLSGTSTPALFYSDVGLINSIGSTITANAAGRFTPMPYGNSTVAYRLVIADNAGTVLDDVDPFYFGYSDYGAVYTGNLINVKAYGAKGDTVLASVPNGAGSAAITSGTDDTAAIQSAINSVNNLGGGTVYFPEGKYKLSTYLTVPKNIRLQGAGRQASWLIQSAVGGGGANAGENVRNGTALYCNSPSNSSTNTNIVVTGLGFHCPSSSSQGTAFYDNCGTQWWVSDCFFSGFKYGAIMDQSELAHFDSCAFWIQAAGGAGLYVVNGDTLTPGNQALFTNQISVKRSLFNQNQAIPCILDEGGYTHSYIDNNYNGGSYQIYAAGVQVLKVNGGEFEGCQSGGIQLEYRRIGDLSSVGGCISHIGNAFLSTGSHPCIIAASANATVISSNYLAGGSGAGFPIQNTGNISSLFLKSNSISVTSQEAVDNHNTFISNDKLPLNVRNTSGAGAVSLTPDYYNSFLQCTNAAATTLTINNDTTTPLPIGTYLEAEQTAAAGPVTVAAGAGVTITGGTYVTAAQYDILKLRKVAANTWRIKKI